MFSKGKKTSLLIVLSALVLAGCTPGTDSSVASDESASPVVSSDTGKTSTSTVTSAAKLSDAMLDNLSSGLGYHGFIAVKERMSSSTEVQSQFVSVNGKATQSGFIEEYYAMSLKEGRTEADELSVANLNTEYLKYSVDSDPAGRFNVFPSKTQKDDSQEPYAVIGSLGLNNVTGEEIVPYITFTDKTTSSDSDGDGVDDTTITNTEMGSAELTYTRGFDPSFISNLKASDFSEDKKKVVPTKTTVEKGYTIDFTADTITDAEKEVAFDFVNLTSGAYGLNGLSLSSLYVVTNTTGIDRMIGAASQTIQTSMMGRSLKQIITYYFYLYVDATGSSVTVKNTEALAGDVDATLDSTLKSLANGNYTEKATVNYKYPASTAADGTVTYTETPYTWETKYTANTFDFTGTRNGKATGETKFVITDTGYSAIRSYPGKGDYLIAAGEGKIPTFDIDAHFFTKQDDGSFVFDAASADYADINLTYSTADFTASDSILFSGTPAYDKITVKLEEGGLELLTSVDYTLKSGAVVVAEYDIHYSAIGTTEAFSTDSIKTTSDDLTWKDFFGSESNYSTAVGFFPSEDFFNTYVPLLGGSYYGDDAAFDVSDYATNQQYNLVGAYYALSEDQINEFISTPSTFTSITDHYATRLSALKLSDGTSAAFTVNKDDSHYYLDAVYNETLMVGGKGYTFEIQVGVVAGQYSYYLAVQAVLTPVASQDTGDGSSSSSLQA